MKKEIAISVQGLSKKYFIGASKNYQKRKIGLRENLLLPFRMLRNISGSSFFNKNDDFIWALKDVSFNVKRGDRLGIIGSNGAGKTTLLKILSRLVYPTEGTAVIRGKVTSLLGVGTGFNKNLTGRENVYLNATLHGLKNDEIKDKFDSIVEFSGVGKFIDTKIKYYSSGMYSRLAFAAATHLDPDILILDEVLAVGDEAFQRKCMEKVNSLRTGGRTILFVSHSMSAISRFCDHAIWMEEGRIIMEGPVGDVTNAYLEQKTKISSSKKWFSTSGKTDNTYEKQNNSHEYPSENEYVRLVSARAMNEERETIVSISADRKIGLEIVYDVLKEGKLLLPAFNFYNEKDVRIFSAVYTDPEWMTSMKQVGRYRSTVWIPPHLLNPGQVYVTLSISTPSSKLEVHVLQEKVINFYVLEVPYGEEGAAGLYKDLPGAVRPKLEWETSPQDVKISN